MATNYVRRFIYSVTYFLSRFVCGTVELVQHSIEIPSGEPPLERFGDGFVMSLEGEQTFCYGRRGVISPLLVVPNLYLAGERRRRWSWNVQDGARVAST